MRVAGPFSGRNYLGYGCREHRSALHAVVHLTNPWSSCVLLQTTSKRIANAKSGKFQQNVHKRGSVGEGAQVRAATIERSMQRVWGACAWLMYVM